MSDISEFFDRLEIALFPRLAHDKLPAEWLNYRSQCEAREFAGRITFGTEYLRRNNAREGLEEAADGSNYGYFEAERVRAQGGDYEEALQLALIAAHHFYLGHKVLHALSIQAPAVPFSEMATAE